MKIIRSVAEGGRAAWRKLTQKLRRHRRVPHKEHVAAERDLGHPGG